MNITRIEINQLALEVKAFPEKICEVIVNASEANGGRFPLELLPTVTTAFRAKPNLLRRSSVYGLLIETAPHAEEIFALAIANGLIPKNPPDDRITLWGLGYKHEASQIEAAACTALYQRDYLWQQDMEKDLSDRRKVMVLGRDKIVESMGLAGCQESLNFLEVVAFRVASRIPEIASSFREEFGVDFPEAKDNELVLQTGRSALMAVLEKEMPFDSAEDKPKEHRAVVNSLDPTALQRVGDAMMDGLYLGVDRVLIKTVWDSIRAIRNRLDLPANRGAP